jgi:hypothetical protein
MDDKTLKWEVSDLPCYFCDVEDPNAIHYNEETHKICIQCSCKLWEVASTTGLEFDIRGVTVELRIKPGI